MQSKKKWTSLEKKAVALSASFFLIVLAFVALVPKTDTEHENSVRDFDVTIPNDFLRPEGFRAAWKTIKQHCVAIRQYPDAFKPAILNQYDKELEGWNDNITLEIGTHSALNALLKPHSRCSFVLDKEHRYVWLEGARECKEMCLGSSLEANDPLYKDNALLKWDIES